MKTNQFKPAKWLGNKHLQSILSSAGPRKILEKRRAKRLLKQSEKHLVITPQGVTLLGYLTRSEQVNSKGLAIILHGWEGSANSTYVLSSGQKLLEQGFDVFRLNLRDHGDTQSLNKALFNSARLQEVLEAVRYLCKSFGGAHNVLCGYSLGGNFCLRIANLAKKEGLGIDQAIAICPVVDPTSTMFKLNNGFPLYEKYFVHKWKRSLFKKLEYYPDFDYGEALKKLKTLDQMNAFFVLGYTAFNSIKEYFDAYSIIGDGLNLLEIPTTIIASLDDPVIPANDFNHLSNSPWLTVELEEKGGHCAFIKNWQFESWGSDRISQLVTEFSH
jgi:predicted alpha/beta-fold hydrolase